MMDQDDVDDALEQDRKFEDIAEELFEVDRSGIALQAALSFLIASTASLGSYLVSGVSPGAATAIFLITFLPNIGLKVIAEFIKKRAFVRGSRQGYKAGRKDSLLSDSNMAAMKKWARVYNVLESATFTPR